MTATNGRKVEAAKVCVERTSSGMYLSIKTSEKFEQLMSSSRVSTSRAAMGENVSLKFYSWDAVENDRRNQLNEIASRHGGVIANYGENLMLDGRINFSILRTQGTSRGIKYQIADGLYTTKFLNDWVSKVAMFVKDVIKAAGQPVKAYSIVVVEE